MYVEITGVCPSCCNSEHFGAPAQDGLLYYTCRRCGTWFSKKNDVLVSKDLPTATNGYLGPLTGEGRRESTE